MYLGGKGMFIKILSAILAFVMQLSAIFPALSVIDVSGADKVSNEISAQADDYELDTQKDTYTVTLTNTTKCEHKAAIHGEAVVGNNVKLEISGLHGYGTKLNYTYGSDIGDNGTTNEDTWKAYDEGAVFDVYYDTNGKSVGYSPLTDVVFKFTNLGDFDEESLNNGGPGYKRITLTSDKSGWVNTLDPTNIINNKRTTVKSTTTRFVPANTMTNGEVQTVTYTWQTHSNAEPEGSNTKLYSDTKFKINFHAVSSNALYNLYTSERKINRDANKTLYTDANASAYRVYTTAMSRAATVMGGGVDQATIDNAYDSLKSAIENLQIFVKFDVCDGTGYYDTSIISKIYASCSASDVSNTGKATYVFANTPENPYNNFQKTGFKPVGWMLSPSSDTVANTFQFDNEMILKPITLYLKWSPIQYTVKFNNNAPIGTTPAGSASDIECLYGEQYSVPNNILINDYVLMGWSTSRTNAASGTFIPVDGKFENLAVYDGETVILYAVWGTTEAWITFDVNTTDAVSGGITETTTKKFSIGHEVDLSVAEYKCSRPGYTFLGWSNSPTAVTALITDRYIPTGSLTLYAVWQPLPVIVNFDLNGGTLQNYLILTTYNYGSTILLPDASQAKLRGKSLYGWEIDGFLQTVTDGKYELNDPSITEITFTAVWTSANLVITLHDNNTSGDATREIPGECGKPLYISNPSFENMSGFEFVGWYYFNTTNSKYAKFEETVFPAESMDLYAGWKAVGLRFAIENLPSYYVYDISRPANKYHYYPKDLEDALTASLNNAKAVYGENGIVYSFNDVITANNALDDLYDAIDALVLKSADYELVDLYVEEYNRMYGGGSSTAEYNKFSDESWAKFNEAIRNIVYGYDVTNQRLVDEMCLRLEEAYFSLDESLADYSKVNLYLGYYDSLMSTGDYLMYEDYSWFDFEECCTYTRESLVFGGNTSYQDLIDSFADELQMYYESLVLKPADYTLYYEEIAPAVERVKSDSRKYTEESYLNLLNSVDVLMAAINRGDYDILHQDEANALMNGVVGALDTLDWYLFDVIYYRNDGSTGSNSIFYKTSAPYGTKLKDVVPLSDPKSEIYNFLGWYTEAVDGEPVNLEMDDIQVGYQGLKFYAHWDNDITRFKLSVDNDYTNSKINIGEKTPAYGQKFSTYVMIGTNVVVTAEEVNGYTFKYWVDSHNRVVSDEPVFTFVQTSDRYLTAVYEPSDNTKYSVTFIDSLSGKVIKVDTVSAGSTAQAPDESLFNQYIGYQFNGWDTDFVNVQSDLTVKTKYINKITDYIVTVAGGKINGDYNNNGHYAYNSLISISIDKKSVPEGSVFAGWSVDGGKTIVSYDENYKFYVYGDMSIVAMYDSAKIVKPAVTIGTVDVSSDVSGFMVTRTVPSGYNLIESGLIMTTDSEHAELLKLENVKLYDDMKQGRTVSGLPDGQYLVKFKTTQGTEYFAVGYLVYMNEDNEIVTVYSDVISLQK